MTPLDRASEYMTRAELDEHSATLTAARKERLEAHTEHDIREWANKFMSNEHPPSVSAEIGAMYHEMVQRVYGVGGG